MTIETVRSELDKSPFRPLRIHLVSGKTVDIMMSGVGWMLQNALLVLHDAAADSDSGYDIIALRNIERVEQLKIVTPVVADVKPE